MRSSYEHPGSDVSKVYTYKTQEHTKTINNSINDLDINSMPESGYHECQKVIPYNAADRQKECVADTY